jgi:3-hydroxyacyl-CoA dehydrogenase
MVLSEFLKMSKLVGVVGAGQMGAGIAYVLATVASKRVVLLDSKQEQLDRAMKLMSTI